MPASRKISASGDVVDDSSSSSDLSLSLRSSGHVDVFGFNLDVRQLFVTLALAYLMLGSRGTMALLIALGAYTVFMRVTRNRDSDGSSSMGGSSRSWGGRGGGGGGGGGGGARIRGVKDLPCDPKGG